MLHVARATDSAKRIQDVMHNKEYFRTPALGGSFLFFLYPRSDLGLTQLRAGDHVLQ